MDQGVYKANDKIRILIVDDHPSFRREIKQLLGTLQMVQVIGEAEDGLQALKMTERLNPDLILMDQKLPGLSGVSATYQIKARWPQIRVLFVATEAAPRNAALAAGAEGYFVKGEDTAVLFQMIKNPPQPKRPYRAPSVKPPQYVPLPHQRLWKTVGVGLGLLLLGSTFCMPRISLPIFALICGLLFFIYGLKYYTSVGLILVATSGIGNNNENGNGFNGVFNGFGATNGLKNGYRAKKPGFLKGLLGRMLGWESNGVTNRIGGNGRDLQLQNERAISVNGFKIEPDEQPFISIHLPLYNETRVVDRLLEACTRLDYKNFEVLVADDSTDETLHHLEKWAKNPKVRISHRINRTGFKGAALKHAMEVMDPRTQYIAVFDADFIPPPNILHQFLSYFYNGNGHNGNNRDAAGKLELVDESLAVVQGYQWHVLNASENWITRGVRTEFSGSYVVERPGQELTGGMKMISGSVFLIRADLLRNLGWGTSITEDWELTIRLYLDGYRVLYSPFIQAPAECVADFKQLARQRMRWSEGHTFNVKKYFIPLIRSPKLTRREKLEFLYYAPYYLQSVFFIIGTLAWFISELVFRNHLPFWTETLGWSLVFTNTFALILMNTAGLFLERGIMRNLAGLLSFVLLTFLLVPYQAYSSLKGLLEPHEGGWHRTTKTGVITDVIDKLGMGRRMQRLMPKRKKKGPKIDLDKRLGLPIAQIWGKVPSPIRLFVSRSSFAFRVSVSLVIGLMLLALFASNVPIVTATPDVFYLRDTTVNGASPAGEDMNLTQGSTEDTLIFDGTDDEAYWYTDVTYPTGGEDASIAAGDYVLNMYFDQLPRPWWNSNYPYRQQITIEAQSADVPSDYSVQFEFDHKSLVDANESLNSGWDVRIVYWNGSGWMELDRLRDDLYPWNQPNTRVWFKTQAAISANTSDSNYYMYYGYLSAGTPPQNWSNVFLFYDNFNDDSFDTGLWSCGGSGASYTEAGGSLTLGADTWIFADSSYAFGLNTRWEARIRLSHTYGLYYNYWGASDYVGYGGDYITYWADDSQHYAEQNDSRTNISPSTPTSYHRYFFDRESSGVRYTQDSSQLAWKTSNIPADNLSVLVWVDAYDRTQTMDYVRVRNYVNPEPTTSLGEVSSSADVRIVVSVYHTNASGGDPQEIVTSATVTIDSNTPIDNYQLLINSGTEQAFTPSDPRRLRVHIDVTAVNGGESFTMAYDSSATPSSLDTPGMTIADVTLLLIAAVILIPVATSLITGKRKTFVWLVSLAVSILVALSLFRYQVMPVSAAIEETTNTFWFYDDTTPEQYMMYQSQPSGTETSAGFTTVYFYSDTFPADWLLSEGTTTIYVWGAHETLFPSINIPVELSYGSGSEWTSLGSGGVMVTDILSVFSGSFETSGHTFASGERLRLTFTIPFDTNIYWDGAYNASRMETPSLTIPDVGLSLLFVVYLIPIVTGLMTRKSRLALRIISIAISIVVTLAILATQVYRVSAEVSETTSTFWFYDDTTPQQYMMYQVQPSGTQAFFDTDFGPDYVYFYSDTFPDTWSIQAGTTTVYMNVYTPTSSPGTITWRLYAGTTGSWTELGAGMMNVPYPTSELLQVSFSTDSYVFDAGEQLRLEAYLTQYLEISWDGPSNTSRMVVPTIVMPEWGLLFIILVPLFPYAISIFWKRRRLAGQLTMVLLAGCITIGLATIQVQPVSAAPNYDVSNSTTFWFYRNTTPLQYMMYQTESVTSPSISATKTTVNFYSDTFPTDWSLQSGSATIYVYATNSKSQPKNIGVTAYAGNDTNGWTALSGSVNLTIYGSISTPTLHSTVVVHNTAYDFTSSDERFRVELDVPVFVDIYWGGGDESGSRYQVPGITVPENAIALVAVAVLIPIVMGAKKRRRRKRFALAKGK